MKKLILICLLIGMACSMQAQNTISIVYHPTDMGTGLRYDRQIHSTGLYFAISKGRYHISETEQIKTHIKTAIGCVKYLKDEYNDFTRSYISAGVSYHYYSSRLIDLPDEVYYPISFDLGCGVKFKKKMIGFVFDFLKNEGGLNFGINF